MVCGRFCLCQAVTNINTLLDKADRVYHQLMGHRPQLESLLSKVNEAAPEKPQVAGGYGDHMVMIWWNEHVRSDEPNSHALDPVLPIGRLRSRGGAGHVLGQCEQVHPAAGSGVQRRLQDLLRRALQDHPGEGRGEIHSLGFEVEGLNRG